jgi:UDP-3-O-acyl-N-acetylglucosamine deacetylase
VIYQQAAGGNTLAAIFYLKGPPPKYRDRLNIETELVRRKIADRIGQLVANPASQKAQFYGSQSDWCVTETKSPTP